jgi:hypothetical protein
MSKSRVSKKMPENNVYETPNNEPSDKFLNYIEQYLSSYTRFPESIHPEFEIRFGTKKIKNINKGDFYNIIKYLALGILLVNVKYIQVSFATINFIKDSKFYTCDLEKIDNYTFRLL